MLKQINDRIQYLPASEKPLSADVFVIRGDENLWFFDVGNCDEALKLISESEGNKKVILSHFHGDHSANLSKTGIKEIYAGAYTLKNLKNYGKNRTEAVQVGKIIENFTMSGIEDQTECVAVEEDIFIEDGVKLHIFPLKCSHAKGSVALEVDETYALIGDAAYPLEKNGEALYNVQLLHDEIEQLKSLKAELLIVSHRKNPVVPKSVIIKMLEKSYANRQKDEAFIKA